MAAPKKSVSTAQTPPVIPGSGGETPNATGANVSGANAPLTEEEMAAHQEAQHQYEQAASQFNNLLAEGIGALVQRLQTDNEKRGLGVILDFVKSTEVPQQALSWTTAKTREEFIQNYITMKSELAFGLLKTSLQKMDDLVSSEAEEDKLVRAHLLGL